MEKFNESKKMAESAKMTQAILGQSQEKGNTTSVFKTEVERESYLYTLSLSESTLDALKMPKEQVEAAKANIRAEMKEALAILKETAVGGTAANYKKREAALKVIDEIERPERMKLQAAAFEALKKSSRTEKAASAVAPLSPDQINTQARLAELKGAAASATVQNNTPEDLARIAKENEATKEARLAASAKKTEELKATLVGAKKAGAPGETTPKTLSRNQLDTQARMAELQEANKLHDKEIARINTYTTKDIGELTQENDNKYKTAITALTTERAATEPGSKERAAIEGLLSQYGSLLNSKNELQKHAKSDTQKLNTEKAFALELFKLEARK